MRLARLTPGALAALILVVASACAEDGRGLPAAAAFSHGGHFAEKDGAALYRAVCQDCHMADGKGASGAGRYPALAANPKLEAAGYPLTLVLQGQGGMPPVGQLMNDGQVAAVVNYVRTHFGNAYADAVIPQDVATLRK